MTPFEAERFRNNLINTINESGLTFPTAFFIVEKVYSEMRDQYYELSKIEPEEKEVDLSSEDDSIEGICEGNLKDLEKPLN